MATAEIKDALRDLDRVILALEQIVEPSKADTRALRQLYSIRAKILAFA